MCWCASSEVIQLPPAADAPIRAASAAQSESPAAFDHAAKTLGLTPVTVRVTGRQRHRSGQAGTWYRACRPGPLAEAKSVNPASSLIRMTAISSRAPRLSHARWRAHSSTGRPSSPSRPGAAAGARPHGSQGPDIREQAAATSPTRQRKLTSSRGIAAFHADERRARYRADESGHRGLRSRFRSARSATPR